MSRPLRIQYAGAWYHVMNRGRRGDEIFENGKEAQLIVENWRPEYNDRRPHSSLGYLTPMGFAGRYHDNLQDEETKQKLEVVGSLSL